MKIGKYRINIEVDNKEAIQELEETQTAVVDTETSMDDLNAAADKASGGIIGGFKAAKTAIIGAIKSINTFGKAFKAAGIGLLVVTMQNKISFIKIPTDIYFVQSLPMEISFSEISSIVIISFSFIFLASFIIGRKISKINTMEALNWKK